MIEHPAEQDTTEWREARYGVPTASRFKQLITPTGRVSTQRDRLLGDLCAEWILGDAYDDIVNTPWMQRGREMEPAARAALEFAYDTDVRMCGVIFKNAELKVAASPDGLMDGQPVEIKCPNPGKHVLWLTQDGIPREHVVQVQGQMWVCGAEKAVWASWCPGLPLVARETGPDKVLHDAFDKWIPRFVAELDIAKNRLRGMGIEIAADWFSRWTPKGDIT